MAIPRPSFTVARSTVLLVAGLAGIAHQTIIEGGDRPTLLVLFAGMIGLPAFLGRDEKVAAIPPLPPLPPAPVVPTEVLQGRPASYITPPMPPLVEQPPPVHNRRLTD